MTTDAMLAPAFLDTTQVTHAPGAAIRRARRHLERSGVRLGHHVSRAIGTLTQRMSVLGASRESALHRTLLRLGVLDRAPSSWSDSPLLDPMPWGAGRYPAPEPELPEGREGPWPQAPVVDPRLYAPVLSVPAEDRLDHKRFIVSRYVGQLVTEIPAAAARARRRGRLVPTDDAELGRFLTETSLGQFVVAGLDEASRRHFEEIVTDAPTLYGRMDFTVVPKDELLPGVYAAPVLVLLRREGAGWSVAAIRVDRRVVTPGDGDTWTLAKCFALQAAQIRLVGSTHPRLHFPADAINAITRTALPSDHPVRRLIEPHTRFTLGLHEAVIHHRRAAIHNSQREVYNPHPFTTEGMHDLIAAGSHGVEGNPAWPAYRFGDDFAGEHVAYGRYRRDWRDAWLRFAADALADVPSGDPAVRAWADHIASWLPGFPDGDAIFVGDALPRAVATYLAVITTFHTADHHSYANIPVEQMPWRLRAPFPATGAARLAALDALVTPEDAFRARLAHAMYFRPAVITSLREVTYRIDPAVVARWHAEMDALDARWGESGFARSEEIASGVHF